MMDGDQNLLELLEIYSNMIETQNETINTLTGIIKKQALEIEHLRTVNDLIEVKG